MKSIKVIRKCEEEGRINLFTIETKMGDKVKKWELASRRNGTTVPLVIQGGEKADAVVIVATVGQKLVVIREYRYGIGDYMYSFPAGLVEPNQTEEEAAVAELFQETGLEIEKIRNIRKNVFSSAGLTDEKVSIVYCEASGELSNKNTEADELIEPLLMDRNDLIKLRNSKDYICAKLAPFIEAYCALTE